MARYEIGLYGQVERNAANDAARAERYADVLGEVPKTGVHRVRCEQDWLLAMSRCFKAEILANRRAKSRERQIAKEWATWEDMFDEAYDENDQDEMPHDIVESLDQLGEELKNDLAMSDAERDREIAKILRNLGRVANAMHRAGFHINVVYGCINRAYPTAIERLKLEEGKAEQATAPKSRVGRTSTVYRIPDAPARDQRSPVEIMRELLLLR